MAAGGSADAQAALLRAGARRGVWRRVLAWLGLGAAARRAEAHAARWAHGARGEEATARLLAPLQAAGWHVRHDLRLRGRQFNVDHVLVSPCGTALVVLDTKNWHRGWTTTLTGGRVHCGADDRHNQVEKVAAYAALIAAAIPLPDSAVWPLVVVHGSPIAGGRLEVPVKGGVGVVHVLGPHWVVPALENAPNGRDPAHAAALVHRVDQVLIPYVQAGMPLR